MAAPAPNCADRVNHPNIAPGVPCHAVRLQCNVAHVKGPNQRNFDVCNTCYLDTKAELSLAFHRPPLTAAPANNPGNRGTANGVKYNQNGHLYPSNNFQRVSYGWTGGAFFLAPPGGMGPTLIPGFAPGPLVPPPVGIRDSAISPDPIAGPDPTVTALPPNHAPNPPWGGFLTALCDGREWLVMSEITHKLATLPVPPVAPAGTDDWDWWPIASCTCRKTLDIHPAPPAPGIIPTRQCFEHLRDQWRQLEKQKDANDIWLRETMNTNSRPTVAGALGRAGVGGGPPLRSLGTTTWANAQTKHNRRVNGTWRACRCGQDTTLPAAIAAAGWQREVYLCMACEGFVCHVMSPLALGASRFGAGFHATLAQLRTAEKRKPNYQLGRSRK